MGVKLFNGGTLPLVPAGRWGEGVVMPGEYIEVAAHEADTYGPPWVRDPEAEKRLAAKAAKHKKSTTTTPEGK